jgi:Tol biopolymer transport system component
MSPDGQTIAFERRLLVDQGDDFYYDLGLMDADGTGERILAANLFAIHGIGPVWSPDGARIVYQQMCDGCFEGHEVVLVTVSDNDPLKPAGTHVVIPPPETTGPDGLTRWYPWSVTWSPDGTTLLYLAWDSVPGKTGVVAVRVDGETPPVVLDDALGVSWSVYIGFPWLPFQSWSRVP